MESTETTEAPKVEVVPKKPRSEAQIVALEAARKKAYSLRAEKALAKKQHEVAKLEAQKPIEPPAPEPPPPQEVEEEIEYVKKTRKPKSAPPKPKRRIVVVEASSSESEEEELEIHLPPKRKQQVFREPTMPPGFESAYNKMFSL